MKVKKKKKTERKSDYKVWLFLTLIASESVTAKKLESKL